MIWSPSSSNRSKGPLYASAINTTRLAVAVVLGITAAGTTGAQQPPAAVSPSPRDAARDRVASPRDTAGGCNGINPSQPGIGPRRGSDP